MTPGPIGLDGNGHSELSPEHVHAIASGEPPTLTNPKQRAALEAILDGCNWTEVARRADVSRTTLLAWRNDPAFVENVKLERLIRQEWCDTHETVVRYRMAQHSLDAVDRVRSIMDGEMPTKITQTRGGDTIEEADGAAVGAQLKAAQTFLPKSVSAPSQTKVEVNIDARQQVADDMAEARKIIASVANAGE